MPTSICRSASRYLAMGRLDEAEAAFRRTLELAPDYADARLGLARVAQRRGDRAAALAELDRIGPGHAEADQLRRQIEAAAAEQPWRWRIDLDGSYSRIEELPDWQSATLVVQHRPGANTTIGRDRRYHAPFRPDRHLWRGARRLPLLARRKCLCPGRRHPGRRPSAEVAARRRRVRSAFTAALMRRSCGWTCARPIIRRATSRP